MPNISPGTLKRASNQAIVKTSKRNEIVRDLHKARLIWLLLKYALQERTLAQRIHLLTYSSFDTSKYSLFLFISPGSKAIISTP